MAVELSVGDVVLFTADGGGRPSRLLGVVVQADIVIDKRALCRVAWVWGTSDMYNLREHTQRRIANKLLNKEIVGYEISVNILTKIGSLVDAGVSPKDLSYVSPKDLSYSDIL